MGGDTDEMSVESDRVRGEKRRREPSEERTNRLPFHQVFDDIPQPQEQYVVCGNGKN